jgi:hypothetical protein
VAAIKDGRFWLWLRSLSNYWKSDGVLSNLLAEHHTIKSCLNAELITGGRRVVAEELIVRSHDLFNSTSGRDVSSKIYK